jgi:hypothetical protein
VEQADPARPVRVVFDRRETSRDAQLVALEVDPPVMLLLATATVTNGQPSSGLWGSLVVISSKVDRVICRSPGEVAL